MEPLILLLPNWRRVSVVRLPSDVEMVPLMKLPEGEGGRGKR